MKPMKKGLVIKSSSWNKDLNDLIDYESYDLNNDSITIHGPGQLRIINDILDFNPYHQDEVVPHIFNQNSSLVDIAIQNGSYYLKKLTKGLSFQEEIDKNPYCPWLMFKGNQFPEKNKRYYLLPGDVIKIGRLKLQVKQIHFGSSEQEQQHANQKEEDEENKKTNGSIHNNNLQLTIAKSSTTKKSKLIQLPENKLVNDKMMSRSKNIILTTTKLKAKRICRICYCEDDSIENPLIRPCFCAGTMKHIHYACLKHWLETKICIKTFSNPFCFVYLIKDIECELCKAPFPGYIRRNGKLYELLAFKPEGKSYVILQSLVKDKKNNKYLYYINYDHTNSVCLGRQQEVEIVLSDISVSRYHCILKKIGKRIYLEDNDSKFGTGILLQSPSILILEGDPLFLQINHSLLQFSIKQPFTLFGCCSEPAELGILTYQRMNSKYLTVFSDDVIKDNKDDSFDEKDSVMSPQQRKNAFLNMIEYTKDENSISQENKSEKKLLSPIVNGKRKEVTKLKKPMKIEVQTIHQGFNDSCINPITSIINPYYPSNSNNPITDNVFSNPNNHSNYNNNVNDDINNNYQEQQYQENEQEQDLISNNSLYEEQQENVNIIENDQYQYDANNGIYEEENNEEEEHVNYDQEREYNNNNQLFNVYNDNN